MHRTDFTRPERAVAFVARLFATILVLLIVVSLVIFALSRVHFSIGGGLPMLVGLGSLCIAAYFIRERRLGAESKPRSTRGAERTPLLPQNTEDE